MQSQLKNDATVVVVQRDLWRMYEAIGQTVSWRFGSVNEAENNDANDAGYLFSDVSPCPEGWSQNEECEKTKAPLAYASVAINNERIQCDIITGARSNDLPTKILTCTIICG